MHEARAGHLDDLGTGVDEQLDRLVEAGLDAGLVAVAGQLLDHARRPLNHLAGGDLVDNALRKLADGH